MKKVQMSNNAHNRCAEMNNDKANNIGCNSVKETKEEFICLVKRDYHRLCVEEQSRLGRVLAKDEKINLYNKSLNSLRDYRRKTGRRYY